MTRNAIDIYSYKFASVDCVEVFVSIVTFGVEVFVSILTVGVEVFVSIVTFGVEVFIIFSIFIILGFSFFSSSSALLVSGYSYRTITLPVSSVLSRLDIGSWLDTYLLGSLDIVSLLSLVDTNSDVNDDANADANTGANDDVNDDAICGAFVEEGCTIL
jgi:hypothetical protein